MTAEGERRRHSMCCQRSYSTKYEVFERVGTPQSAQLVSLARDAVAGRDAFSDQSNLTADTSHYGP